MKGGGSPLETEPAIPRSGFRVPGYAMPNAKWKWFGLIA
jgi:hypothetical protein